MKPGVVTIQTFQDMIMIKLCQRYTIDTVGTAAVARYNRDRRVIKGLYSESISLVTIMMVKASTDTRYGYTI